MASTALIVPVMKNFFGFTELMQSVDMEVLPIIYNNWDHNVGVTKAWNDSIDVAISKGCRYIFIVNDDIILEPGSMAKLTETLDEGHDLVSILNTRDYELSTAPTISHDPDFSCFVISPETVKKFGYFDPKIHSYFNDNDYHYRIKVGGGSAVCRRDAGALHRGSITQNFDPNNIVVSHQAFELTRSYYVSKWGGVPGNETYVKAFNRDS